MLTTTLQQLRLRGFVDPSCVVEWVFSHATLTSYFRSYVWAVLDDVLAELVAHATQVDEQVARLSREHTLHTVGRERERDEAREDREGLMDQLKQLDEKAAASANEPSEEDSEGDAVHDDDGASARAQANEIRDALANTAERLAEMERESSAEEERIAQLKNDSVASVRIIKETFLIVFQVPSWAKRPRQSEIV